MDSPSKDSAEIRKLLVGAGRAFVKIPVDNGVFMVFGNKNAGKNRYYIEVFSPNDASLPERTRFLTDVKRLYEYAVQADNEYRFRRPE